MKSTESGYFGIPLLAVSVFIFFVAAMMLIFDLTYNRPQKILNSFPYQHETLSPAMRNMNKEQVMPNMDYETVKLFVNNMSVERQASQLFLVRMPDSDVAEHIKQYCPGGYLLSGSNLADFSTERLSLLLSSYNSEAEYPLFFAVDDNGANTICSFQHSEKAAAGFHVPSAIYRNGGIVSLLHDTQTKSGHLKNAGINLILSPVFNVPETTNSYMYKKSLRLNLNDTAECIKHITGRMIYDNIGFTLKYFPGYGNSPNPRDGTFLTNILTDNPEKNDFLPLTEGIRAGAMSVMAGGNIITSSGKTRPASLSHEIYDMLRNNFSFNGVIIAEDLSVNAPAGYTYTPEDAVSAILAGSDMIISSDFALQYKAVLAAVKSGKISKNELSDRVIRIIKWKYALHMIR